MEVTVATDIVRTRRPVRIELLYELNGTVRLSGLALTGIRLVV